MKRNKVLPVCFSDVEFKRLSDLAENYRASGGNVSMAAIIRYGISLVPSQPNLETNGVPFL